MKPAFLVAELQALLRDYRQQIYGADEGLEFNASQFVLYWRVWQDFVDEDDVIDMPWYEKLW
jgi:hypothetical protein